MCKRALPLILAVCLACSCLISPAYAAESGVSQQLLNVLEFDTVNSSGDYFLTSSYGKATASFNLPYGTLMRYIDMYVSTPNISTICTACRSHLSKMAPGPSFGD